MDKDIVAVYVRAKGSKKKNLFIEYLISEGINVKVIETSGEIRGMKLDYVIVDELAKGFDDE